jgi:hypothetical protein
MMDDINSFALQQAELAAARLWAFGSAPYPFSDGRLIQRHIEQEVTNTAIAFAIHVRRILDNKAVRTRFVLSEPFRLGPSRCLTKVDDLRDALNRIIHATEFKVGFDRLPEDSSKIQGGAVGVIYLSTRTDQRDEALIDVFALASCFFHQVVPELQLLDGPSAPKSVH